MRKFLTLLIAVCMLAVPFGTAFATSEVAAYTPGTYTAEAFGNIGPIAVTVVFDETSIVSVEITDHKETLLISEPAIELLPTAIVEAQSLAIDTVAGATYTSEGIIDAVTACAIQAGADMNALFGITDRSVEVLVVGGGLAGMVSAISAAESGAQVLLIEKMPVVGGTTATAGGGLIAVEVPVELDFDNSIDRMMPFWENTAKIEPKGQDIYPDFDRASVMLAKTGETIEYLSALGVPFAEKYSESAAYASRSVVGGGAALMASLRQIALDKGVEIIVNCKAESLIVEDDAVVGVLATTPDGTLAISAKGVVLATGGFIASPEMLAEYIPETANLHLPIRGSVGNTGDGMRMAEAIGAGTFENYWIATASITFSSEYAHALGLTTLSSPGSAKMGLNTQLAVNAKGERFMSERNAAGAALVNTLMYEGNGPHYFIFDSSNPENLDALEIGVALGETVKGETIEALATEIGADPAVLTATFDKYGEAVAAGEDAEFGKDAEYLVAYGDGPYYGVKIYPSGWGTMGGVQTDIDGRVIREDGSVIKGLYAAGEMSNRYFYGQAYVGGASLALYSTVGRIVGATVVADSK